MRNLLLAVVAVTGFVLGGSTALAQPRADESREEVLRLRREIEELKATVVRLNGMIERLESRLKRLEPEPDVPYLRFPMEVERAMTPEGTVFPKRPLPELQRRDWLPDLPRKKER